ncbi:MAG: 30S ribosomal protein S17 [Anaerolineaceae bacterium]|nr:30S ribosomal protein S17 [Anaerolineaceae bacterium]MBN2676543.1 30S ribosomal protein S17 [Anaerolineaceae bacterium]
MNKRRRMIGVVTSNKMTKSVVVKIPHSYRHPLYKKVIHTSRAIMAHDDFDCQMGDQVQLVESRPISKRISWVVEKVIKKEEKTITVDASVEIEPAPVEIEEVVEAINEEQPVAVVPVEAEDTDSVEENAGDTA